ncbi:MAG: phenylacetate-CoA oxygenase subunit PaaI [Gammaproteobacteria bacterium]|nr:phenylacetate-CoA oxygenase subunit PaaI [Gammaproteobacteria bacterium]MDE0273499.1 phenylacetate-CoA oxygenase subunit PaaI [Gammaproteobacteria bacterium]
MSYPAEVTAALKSELLCIADSNWALGHWYVNCMLNGRELTDFTSMAGIAEEKLGHARALFRFMEEYYGLAEHQLEFARSAAGIHSLALLDAPPENWADFILTLHLADQALWRFSATLRTGDFAPAANLITRFGEEAYFHQLCIDGWLKALDDGERHDLATALPARLPLVLQWFDGPDPDPLLDAGIRTEPLAQAREQFKADVRKLIESVPELSDEVLELTVSHAESASWDAVRRRPRGSALPPRLWESMVPTSEEAKLARRPLAVSVDDNIDLFGKAKKDDTEPQF